MAIEVTLELSWLAVRGVGAAVEGLGGAGLGGWDLALDTCWAQVWALG